MFPVVASLASNGSRSSAPLGGSSMSSMPRCLTMGEAGTNSSITSRRVLGVLSDTQGLRGRLVGGEEGLDRHLRGRDLHRGAERRDRAEEGELAAIGTE